MLNWKWHLSLSSTTKLKFSDSNDNIFYFYWQAVRFVYGKRERSLVTLTADWTYTSGERLSSRPFSSRRHCWRMVVFVGTAKSNTIQNGEYQTAQKWKEMCHPVFLLSICINIFQFSGVIGKIISLSSRLLLWCDDVFEVFKCYRYCPCKLWIVQKKSWV